MEGCTRLRLSSCGLQLRDNEVKWQEMTQSTVKAAWFKPSSFIKYKELVTCRTFTTWTGFTWVLRQTWVLQGQTGREKKSVRKVEFPRGPWDDVSIHSQRWLTLTVFVIKIWQNQVQAKYRHKLLLKPQCSSILGRSILMRRKQPN